LPSKPCTPIYAAFHLPSLLLLPRHGIMLGMPPLDGNRRAASMEYEVRSSNFNDEGLRNPSEDGEPKGPLKGKASEA